MKKQAVAYLRTSTASQQEEGKHSIESQRKEAERFLEQFPDYELTEVITDAASAFKQDHLTSGNFGEFVRQAEQGEHEGKLLIVVYVDRLTRGDIDTAFNTLSRLAKSKVHLGIASLGQFIDYNVPLEFGLRMTLTALFHVANADSSNKSRRIRDVFKTRHEKIVAGTYKKTNGLPSWVSLVDGEYQVSEYDFITLTQMFSHKLNMGCYRLVKWLQENRKPFEGVKGWTYPYVNSVLRNIAVMGYYQAYETYREDGTDKRRPYKEPVADYYPEVITDELFYRVQNSFQIVPKGMNSTNPFRGVMRCNKCGGGLSINKTRYKGHVKQYFRCENRKASALTQCDALSVRYEVAESRILALISNIDLSYLEQTRPHRDSVQGQIDGITKRISRLEKLSLAVDDEDKADEYIKQVSELVKERKQLESSLYQVSSKLPDFSTISPKDNPEDFNAAIRDLFEFIAIDRSKVKYKLRDIYDLSTPLVTVDFDELTEEQLKFIGEGMQMVHHSYRTPKRLLK